MGWKSTGGGGTDADAIHDNVAGEIDAITEATPLSGDWVLFEDTSDGDNKKKADAGDFLAGSDPTWQAFSPTWTAASVAPAIGNGSLTGRFIQFGAGTGTLIIAAYYLNPGSTTTFGTGEWAFTLPAACVATRQLFAGAAWAFDSGTAWFNGIVEVASTTTVKISDYNNIFRWGAASPITWVDADSAGWSISYEVA